MAYRPSSDKYLLSIVVLLTILGLLMVYSASFVTAADKHGDSYYFFLRQLGAAGFGFLAMFGLMRVDYHFFQKPKALLLISILTAAALIYVLSMPAVNGARRWIYIKGLSIQPSEFAKLLVLIFIAWFLHKYGSLLNRPKYLTAICAFVAFFAVLIVIEPDFGQALKLCLITMILLAIAGLKMRYLAGAVIGLSIPVFYFFVYTVPYRWSRFAAFLDPEIDTAGTSYQITQSLITVGSGGIFGLGLGDGRQKLAFLPEASTDFIFAIICEELGLIGAALVIAAFMVFFYRGMKISLKAPDKFGFYLGMGITLMITLQGLINITMVIGLLPTTGIALPFISRGGSSLLMNLAAAGILLNLSYQSKLVEGVE